MHIVIVGAGRMGAGIGLGFAGHGASVTYMVRDRARAEARIAAVAAELIEIGPPAWPASDPPAYTVETSIDRLPRSELIVESIPEDLELKVPLLRELSEAQPDALLCSNTSSLPITELAAQVVSPERVAGMHFWYPPPLMPLVELVPGEMTSTATLDSCEQVLRNHGKTPVRLRADNPGFVWNRLTVAVLREAKALVESGLVNARTVDLVVEQGLARRWSLTGPFASAILGGVPTFETVGRNLLPLLSSADDLEGLTEILDGYIRDPEALARWRNRELNARDRADRSRGDPPAR